MESLRALSPLDGRYETAAEELKDIFSEYALIKFRVFVEIQWFKFLSLELKLFSLNDAQIKQIGQVYGEFTVEDAERIKEIEKTTNHDVKAVEYFLKEKFSSSGLDQVAEWIHFSCTSADINNTSYALMVKKGNGVIGKYAKEVLKQVEGLAKEYKSVAMMSKTHGQPATPTTVGKEFVNFAWRLDKEINTLEGLEIQAKINGATGNFNAHYFAFSDIDWISSSHKFLKEYLNVTPILLTTQVNPNHYLSEILHCLIRIAAIVIDLDRDLWGYIAFGYFKQKLKEGEIGSSTMPHKVNPIDFENSEGNCGVAISLMQHLSTKLLNSRFQRDLTDSTVMRNLGSAFGHVLLALKSTQKGLNKIDINLEVIAQDLDSNWELLAEPIQTVMRVYGEENPYEKLKGLTRGTKISKEQLAEFVDGLQKVPEDVKKKMKELSPASYVGLAQNLVDYYFKGKK